MPAPLFTIGYEGRSLEELIRLLQREDIRALVDVRENAWSHKPGFSKTALRAALEGAGIAYVHAAFVGNPKRFRASGASIEHILGAYARHLEDHPGLLDRFLELTAELEQGGRRACLLCFERAPAECHRGILGRHWQERTRGQVVHIDAEPAVPSSR